jgi:hypothetical protein
MSGKTEFDFEGANSMTTKGKVLVLVSSGRALPLKDGKVYAGADYYLNELTVPVRALMQEGYEITFASPDARRNWICIPLFPISSAGMRRGCMTISTSAIA